MCANRNLHKRKRLEEKVSSSYLSFGRMGGGVESTTETSEHIPYKTKYSPLKKTNKPKKNQPNKQKKNKKQNRHTPFNVT